MRHRRLLRHAQARPGADRALPPAACTVAGPITVASSSSETTRADNAYLLRDAARHHRPRRALEPAVARRLEVDRLQRRALQLRRGARRARSRADGRSRHESDTEVLLSALDEAGTEALDSCEGMWAFAVYDERDGTLTLSPRPLRREAALPLSRRDRHLLRLRGEVHLRAARADARAESRPGLPVPRQRLQGALQAGRARSSKGCEELPAGDDAPRSMRTDARRQRRYWSPVSALAERQHELRGRRSRACASASSRSVELRLRADVPLAFCMSGGVDSLSLISIAKRVLGYDVHGFTISTRTSATTSRT